MEFRHPTIHKVNDHIWLLNDNNEATGYLVAGTERAMVIDTMIGYVNVYEEVRKLTDLPLLLVNTHGHGDHIGGNWSFDHAYMNHADLQVAKESLEWPEVRAAIDRYDLKFPEYQHIEDGEIFDLGGISLQAYYMAGHTPGEIVLLDRKDRILFSGDAVLEQLWMQLPSSLPLSVLIESMEKFGREHLAEFDVIYSGHSQKEPYDASLYDELLKAAIDLKAGNTEGDTEYEWFGGGAMAHPYGNEPRKIVYNKQKL